MCLLPQQQTTNYPIPVISFLIPPLIKSIHFNVQLDATTLITPGIASKLIFKLIVVHYWTSLINRVHFGTTLFAF